MAENENVVVETTTETTPSVDLNAEIARLKDENAKLKSANDKSSHDAAEFKRALREKLSEQEKAEADRAEKDAAIQAELAQYREQNRISAYKEKLIANGYDLDTATAMSKGLPEGIPDEFFASQKVFLDSMTKAIESKLLNNQPGLSTGNAPTVKDIEDSQLNELRRYAGLIK